MVWAIPFGRKIKENPAAISLILLVFAVWHAVTYVCDNQEPKGIPGIGQYICGNNISSIEDTKFQGVAKKSVTGNINSFKDCHIMDPCSLKRS